MYFSNNILQIKTSLKDLELGWKDVQWITLVALPDDLSSVSSSHVAVLNSLIPVPGNMMPSTDLSGTRYALGAQTYM